MPKGTIFHRLAAAAILSLVLLAGCGTNIHPPVHANLIQRLQHIHTVALSPAYVQGYTQSYHLSETRETPVPDTAITNFSTTIREQFGERGLHIQDLDMRDSSLAPPTPPWDVSCYGPALTQTNGMNFKPKAFTAPAEDISADAALFVFAWQTTSTGGAIFKKTNPWV